MNTLFFSNIILILFYDSLNFLTIDSYRNIALSNNPSYVKQTDLPSKTSHAILKIILKSTFVNNYMYTIYS